MVNKGWSFMTIAVASIFAAIILLGSPEIVGAKPCAVVDINRNNSIEPETLEIAQGDCVQWLNWGGGAEVIFSEGQKSKGLTKDPVRFKMDSEGRYLTDYFGPNETASLLFPKKGSFNYEVKFKPKAGDKMPAPAQQKISGTITVE